MNMLLVSESFMVVEGLETLFKDEYKDINIKTIKKLNKYSDLDGMDFIFVDIRNDISSQLEFIEYGKKILENKIVILDLQRRGNILKKAIELGIDGYLVDIIDKDEFLYIINKIMLGKKFYDAESLQKMFKHEKTHIKYDITKREEEVLKLIGQGLNNKEIGKRLYITEYTVKKHISNIFIKLKLKNRSEAIEYIKYNGLSSK